jgi:hypothetical protein
VRLGPDETYEAVFPIKITKKFVEKVLSRSIESAGYKEQIQQLREPKDPAQKALWTVQHWLKFFDMVQVQQLAELHFDWKVADDGPGDLLDIGQQRAER